jgi:hypothetical protein
MIAHKPNHDLIPNISNKSSQLIHKHFEHKFCSKGTCRPQGAVRMPHIINTGSCVYSTPAHAYFAKSEVSNDIRLCVHKI